jgi:hypothetical protein
MAEGSGKAREISLGEDLGAVVVRVNGATIEVSSDGVAKVQSAPANDTAAKTEAVDLNKLVDPYLDSGLYLAVTRDHTSVVATGKTIQEAANQAAAQGCSEPVIMRAPGRRAEPEIGDIERAGDHKGEIYGGILPSDNKPIWFSAAPKSMDHFNAASWATEQGGALPTRKQGDYLTTLRGKGGAFTELFNRGGSFPAGYVWLAEPNIDFRDDAWCQRLSDGGQIYDSRYYDLPVLCVRR